MEKINTKNAPSAIGPYSQGIKANGFIYVSGQLPVDPTTGILKENIKEATLQSLTNIESILKEGNSDRFHIVKINIFLKDMSFFTELNEAYNEFFKDPYPARSCVAVKSLPKDAVLEIEAIATYEE